MVVFIANIGERDLYYNIGTSDQPDFCHFEIGKDCEKQVAEYLNAPNGARYISKAILKRLQKNFDAEAERVRYPILKTVIEEGLLGSDAQKVIDKVFLVVTDQPEDVQENFRRRDSVYTGQIIKRLLEEDYPDQICSVEIVTYPGALPEREQTYSFFGEFLPRMAPPNRVHELHASISGGVPALNDSLQEQALRLYRSKCFLYEVAPPKEEDLRSGLDKGALRPVSSKPFLRDLAVSIIEQLLDRYDYSGALEVLRMFKPVKFWKDDVEAVLRHAQFRLNLNFGEATGVLNKYKQDQPFCDWYQTADQPEPIDRITEAYFVAESRYRNREYADMLWRIRSIYEIGEKLINGKWAIWMKQPNSFKQCKDASSLLNKLLGLKNLSNDMLHHLKGVTLGDINEAFSPPQVIRQKHPNYNANHNFILPTLKEIILLLSNLVGRKGLSPNPYQSINEYLLRRLKFNQDEHRRQ